MSGRMSFVFAVIILLGATFLRVASLTTLPTGYTDDEITNIRITETARDGTIEVFYNLGDEGREGMYHVVLTMVTSVIGRGTLGYRMLSVWIGIMCLATTYAIGRRVYGEIAGLGAMALLAVMFYPILLSRQISPTMMLPAIMSAVLLLLSMTMPVYRRRWQRGDNTIIAATLGFVLGLGIYIHPTGLFILLGSLLFISYMLRSRRSMSRRRLSYIGFSLVIFIIMSIPYIISTIRRPQLGGLDRLGGDSAGLPFLSEFFEALAGLFITGDTNPFVNLPARPLLDPITAILVIVGIGIALRGYRQPRYAILLIPTLILSPIYLFSPQSPNFVNLSALLPLLALYFGIGVYTIIHHLPALNWQRMAGAGLLALLVVHGSWTYHDMFREWINTPEIQAAKSTRLGLLAAHIDRGGDMPMVVCGFRFGQSPSAPTLSDSQIINLHLNRHDRTALRYADCTMGFIMIEGGARQQVIVPDTVIFDIADKEILAWLRELTPVDAPHLPIDGVFELDVEQMLADRLGLLVGEAGPPLTYAPNEELPQSDLVHTPISFEGNLTLLGYIYDVGEDGVYSPNDVVRVVTYWRTEGTVPPDLRLFTHILIDPGARPPANTDILNVQARFLQDRDIVVQATHVFFPENFPAGEYILSIGSYQDTSGIRLNALEEGIPRSSSLFLGRITVAPADDTE